MKSRFLFCAGSLIAVATACFPVGAKAQSDDGKPTIGIHSVEITDAVRAATLAISSNKLISLQRVADSLGQQLIDRIHNTRKFTIVSRSDLNTLIKDQDLQRMFSDPGDANVPQAFKIAGCKYALAVTIDDFQDLQEELRLEGGQAVARKRTVRMSTVAKIYDTTSGKLLETANFQISKKEGAKIQFGAGGDGTSDDALLIAMTREMAQDAANRVIDVVFPAKIVALTGKLATINRGDGTGIAKGQVWTVYAIGEPIVDPDTKEVLGVQETPIGKVKITSVTPKFSQAEVIEDYGVETMQIIRMDEEDHAGGT